MRKRKEPSSGVAAAAKTCKNDPDRTSTSKRKEKVIEDDE